MKHIFICKIKLIGMPFAVLTEEEAKEWEAQDPDSNYYEKTPIQPISLPSQPLTQPER